MGLAFAIAPVLWPPRRFDAADRASRTRVDGGLAETFRFAGWPMSSTWKQGTGLGDVRLDERAALVFEQMVASTGLSSSKSDDASTTA